MSGESVEPQSSLVVSPLWTVKQVAAFLAVSVAHVYRLREDPMSGFPSAIRVGSNTLRWRADDVLDWIAEQQER